MYEQLKHKYEDFLTSGMYFTESNLASLAFFDLIM